ncbi:MAG: hypothetical protein A2157_05475 [Deltaproteobacteria bacterium RBG_16_47_11]|nr:MAG: hypothetical protein A2157_05475 [Deltaproteobacteria bacterium RBG_16_47_11]
MRIRSKFNEEGITLIELLIALVIFGIASAGSYRLFVAQTKAYTVQDQVIEIQQNIRTAMEILLRDIRMAGFDNDRTLLTFSPDISIIPGNHSVTVNYEYDDTHRREVAYSIMNGNLIRQETTFPVAGPSSAFTESILENVDALDFNYGVDTNDPPDGAMDNWVLAGSVGMAKVVAVRVVLTAKPDQTNPDVKNWVSPRTLESIVALRNLALKH